MENGASGLLCSVKDVESLYARMESFLKLSPAERCAMGLAGRVLMQERFEKGMVVDMTVDTIKARVFGAALENGV